MSEQSDNQNNSSASGDALLSLLGKLMGSASPPPPQPQVQVQTQPTQANTSNAPGADLIGSLLSNPEIISKLPQMLSVLKPLMSGASAANAQPKNDATPAALISNTGEQKPQRGMDDRTALLYAMKPYLKRERREAIDYMVKLSKLGDILKSL